jgi:hypothetical protein
MIRERVNADGARARADKHCGRPFIETKLEMLWLLLVALACTRSPSSSGSARGRCSASRRRQCDDRDRLPSRWS